MNLPIVAVLLFAGVAPVAPADTIAPATARADTTNPSAAGDRLAVESPRRMTDSVTVLPPVRVEGDRVADEAPRTGTRVRLSRGQLLRFLPGTTGEALLAAPGVDLVRTGAWSSQIAVRGLSGERVLVLVDGVRLSSGRGHAAQTSLVPVERLDAVEVTPGSGGAGYGSDALGGVVNLVTHRDLFATSPTIGTSFLIRGSTPGSYAGTGAKVRWRSPSFGAEISGGVSRLESLVTPEGALTNSGNRDADLTGRLNALWGRTVFDLEQSHHSAHDVGIPAFADENGSRGSYPLQARDATRLEIRTPGDEAWRPALGLLASMQRFRTDFEEIAVSHDSLRGRLIATTTNTAYDRIRTDAYSVRPEARFGAGGAVRVSGEWRREESTGPRTTVRETENSSGTLTGISTNESASMPDAWREAWATGVTARADRWSLRWEAGARYDDHHTHADEFAVPEDTSRIEPPIDAHDHRWSLEGGVSRPFGAWEPYAHLASGFRVPSLEERFFKDEVHGGMRVFGNRDLSPERSTTGEIGVRAEGERGLLRLSAYRSDVNDLISLRYQDLVFGLPNFQYENVDRARLEGVELVARWRTERGSVAVQGALPRGTDLETGAKLTDIGAARVTFDLGAPLSARWFPQGALGLRARWTDAVAVDEFASEGERQALPRPAAWVLSAEAAATVLRARITLAVGNLLDHAYREPLGFIYEPGRTVTLTLRRDFDVRWGGGPGEAR